MTEEKRQPLVVEFRRPVHRWLKREAFERETHMGELVRAAVDAHYATAPGYPKPEQAQQ